MQIQAKMDNDPYSPEIWVNGHLYYPAPYSLDPVPHDLRHGLIPVGLLAVISVSATLTLITFILYRLATWKLHYRTFLGYNQYVLLVLNLLIADLQQSAAFLFSFHWIRIGSILAPSPPCFGQAWLLHSGDMSSGLFVLAIAIHTFRNAVQGKRVGHKTFATIVVCIWVFAYFLTLIGVLLNGTKYFVRAGAWCWVSVDYEGERLAFHYIWVFLVQFGTVLIYIVTFFQLRRKTKRIFAHTHNGGDVPNKATIEAVNRITMLMVLYPCFYVLLTLPLSAGRMWSMAHDGKPYSNAYACVAGAMITSCGWVDTLLYTLTRRRLLKDTMPSASSRRARESSAWDNEMGSKGITHTRTVTVEGGHNVDAPYPALQIRRASVPLRNFAYDRTPPSPSESLDPILSGQNRYGRNMTEVSVGLKEMLASDPEKREDTPPLPRGWVRHREP